MKRIAIAFILLFTIFLGCAAALKHFEAATNDLIYQAQSMKKATEQQQTERSHQALSKLCEIWQNERNFFHLLSGSECCEELEQSLEQVKHWSKQKEKSPELLSELSKLILSAEHLSQTQTPSINNLF